MDSAGRLPVSDAAGSGHHHESPALKDEDAALDYVRALYKAYDGRQAVLAYAPTKRRKQPSRKKTKIGKRPR